MQNTGSHSGHRERLRQQILTSGSTGLADAELLEILLTYAIPRQDVAPLARQLLEQFGGVSGLLNASHEQLLAVPGIGDHSAILVEVVGQLSSRVQQLKEPALAVVDQPRLFEAEQDLGPLFQNLVQQEGAAMRVFANDEIANSLALVPQAAQFNTYEAYKEHLQSRLPYNSESTRFRRANHILERFFPEGRLDVPLTYYASHSANEADLKPVLFYHVAKAEPLVAKVAEELVWPALPIGRVERESLREFVLQQLPDLGESSQRNTLRSILTAYDLLDVGVRDEDTLRFQAHAGTLEAFLYVLTAEFPEPGMYRFELLEQGPMRTWLLWDREWMQRQLYNLRDLGIVAKVSQIDTLRQFTLEYDQWAALQRYFEHPELRSQVLRERPLSEPAE